MKLSGYRRGCSTSLALLCALCTPAFAEVIPLKAGEDSPENRLQYDSDQHADVDEQLEKTDAEIQGHQNILVDSPESTADESAALDSENTEKLNSHSQKDSGTYQNLFQMLDRYAHSDQEQDSAEQLDIDTNIYTPNPSGASAATEASSEILLSGAADAPTTDLQAQLDPVEDNAPPSPEAATGGMSEMSLFEVIRRAILESPERRAARAQIQQAVASVDEARSGYFPQANLKLEAGGEYNNPYAVKQGATPFPGQNYGNSGSINIRQMLFDGFVTSASVEQRLQQTKSARLSRDKVHEEIVATTVEVYMQLRQYQQALVIAEDNLDKLRAIAALVDMRAEAGDTSKSEQDYMRARLAAAEQAVISTRSFLKDAMSTLTYLIGEVEPFSAVLPEKAPLLAETEDAATQQALAGNIDVRLSHSDLQAARYELQGARGRYFPNLNFVVDGNHSEDLGGEVGVKRALAGKLELNIRLYDGGLRSAGVQRQLGRISEIKARGDRIQRELTQNVRQAFNKLQTAAAELRSTEEEINANTDLATVYLEQFQFGDGDVDITRLVESQERIYAAQVKKTRLESDQIIADIQLRRLNGTLLQEFCERCHK
jgi:adhesin transport system outer membrane protein